ncbi:hypothetical protein ATCV1_z621L [Acanthocystis turfacea chlorella virus 1]|uniref:Uncharacterized protein z621L n=1 Tax=Chlorovirus heliozoae TaxID=322019 RepID=A7K9N1_9PHYC|nr:hypothetical protein ATCV1_z621L [Acanthocystis turfacea chlorella virus 1]ABT16755.1 hypothetical protein ATCV1_z621L [Acanthocystis turfacea chlorella virus 1]
MLHCHPCKGLWLVQLRKHQLVAWRPLEPRERFHVHSRCCFGCSDETAADLVPFWSALGILRPRVQFQNLRVNVPKVRWGCEKGH